MDQLESNLVSLVVPCYNVGPYIDRFILSILSQNYRYIQIIFVDDGSTDDTWEMIRRATPELLEHGWEVVVVRQSNQGLAAAINSGLGHVRGEFLLWPDPDDWLTPNSIQRRVELLRNHPECGLLRTNVSIFNQQSGKDEGPYIKHAVGTSRLLNLHRDILLRKVFTAPVMHTVRSAALFDCYPNRRIFSLPLASQNFQILIPIAARYPVIQSSEVLAVYRRRADSRSHFAATHWRRRLRRNEVARQAIQSSIDVALDTSHRRLALGSSYDTWFILNYIISECVRKGLRRRSLRWLNKSGISTCDGIALRIVIRLLALRLKLPKTTHRAFHFISHRLILRMRAKYQSRLLHAIEDNFPS